MVTLEHYVETEYQISGTGKVIIGKTPVMLQLFDYLNRLTNVPATVLLQGETGTGKELFAQALHHNGTRSTAGPLVVVNCAQIPSELLESILFGHVRGAFTGAIKDARGVFRTADRGTLFLDEISEMSYPLQAKMLRALQEGEVQPVGAARVEKVDVRVVAATNKDLRGEVKAGRFREDLYYRLSVAPIRIPPLRERREDIPLLAEYILNRLNLKYTATATGFSRQALEALSQKEWNGNIRELENVIERSLIFRREGELAEDDLLFGFDLHRLPARDKNVLPISVIELSKREGSYSPAWIDQKAKKEEDIYAPLIGLGSQRKSMIIYLTQENWRRFFRNPETVDALEISRMIDEGDFNKIIKKPFRFYSRPELVDHHAVYSNTRALERVIGRTRPYTIQLGKTDGIVLTLDSAPHFVPHNEHREMNIATLRRDILGWYATFEEEFLKTMRK